MSTSRGAASGSTATAAAPRVAALVRVAIAAAIAIGAQGNVAAAPRQADGFTAWVYATSLEWQAQPGQRVAGELRDGSAVVAHGSTVANAVGDYTLRFQPAGPGMDAVFRPGRVLVIRPDGSDAVTETVPALHVDVASDRQHVEGRVPPGASVGLEGVREGRLQRIGEAFVSPEDGQIRIPVDALDPERSGFVHATLASGHTFSAPFVAFSLDVEVGGRSIVGRASAGTSIEGVVELAPSGTTHRIARREVHAGRSWREDLPASMALDAGAVITLTRTSPAFAAPLEMALPVPTLRVAAMPTEVYGEGPPDTELHLELRAPGQATTTHVVRTDAAGRYRLAVDAEQPIGAGWQIRAVLDTAPGVRFWASVPFFPIEVGLYTGTVTGVVDVPGAVVRGVLRDADDRVRAFSQATAKAQSDHVFPAGYFNLTFVGELFQPGDAIELDWRNGDPVLLNVPEFTARVDHVADVVSGEAPPGSRVEVATYADGGSRPGVLVNLTTMDVDVDGRYTHSFRTSARYDVQPQETGHAAVVTSQGYRFTTRWRSLVLAWGAGASSGGLSGSGLPDRALRVELMAPSGERIARYEETLSTHGWTADVKDTAGQSVRAQAGDRFEVSMGDQTATLVVPELFGIAHVADDLITGRTQPRTRVLITIVNLDSGRYHEATMSNDTGVFLHEFGSLFDMRHNAGVTMKIDLPGGHTATSRIYSPGTRVDLDAVIVTGAHEPGIDVEGIVERSGFRVAGGTARAALNGDYVLNLLGERGLNLSLIAGDVLRILAPTAEFAPELSLRVPAFSMTIDAATRAVHGHAEPSGWLSLLARPVFSRQIKIGYDVSDSSTDVSIDSDGAYRIAFPDATKGVLRPGQLFDGRYVLPDGHIVTRRRVVPIANVQLGGDQVCGFGVPGDAVTVTLRKDRMTIATAAGTVGGDSRFAFALRDQGGDPVQTLAGQRVDLAIGNQGIAMDLPELTIDTRWQVPFEGMSAKRTVISGSAPPATEFVIAHPTADCFTTARGNPYYMKVDGTTSARGTFSGEMFQYPLILTPGTTVQVALFTHSGHRYYARVDRPLVRAHVFSDRIDGRAAPFAGLSYRLLGPGGAVKATAQAQADAAGAYAASFARDDQPVSTEPGDTIELTPLGDAIREAGDVEQIAVDLLTFDFSAAAGLIGRAPAGRTVTVQLDLGDKGLRTFQRAVDARGHFGYGPADLPPRADWKFGDVRSVLLTLPTADGHEIVADGSVGFVPEPPPRAFVPFAVRR